MGHSSSFFFQSEGNNKDQMNEMGPDWFSMGGLFFQCNNKGWREGV